MNLTEPHAARTSACFAPRAKQGDGSYKITGTKIFISAGEHDLDSHIIHLVLARTEGAPEGTRASRCRPSEIFAEARWIAGRAQRRGVRLARREDGHPRQLDLRHELRRLPPVGSWARRTAGSTPCSR